MLNFLNIYDKFEGKTFAQKANKNIAYHVSKFLLQWVSSIVWRDTELMPTSRCNANAIANNSLDSRHFPQWSMNHLVKNFVYISSYIFRIYFFEIRRETSCLHSVNDVKQRICEFLSNRKVLYIY